MDWELNLHQLIKRVTVRLGLPDPSFRYDRGFPLEYKTLFSPRRAIRDVLYMDRVVRGNDDAFDLRPPTAGDQLACHYIVFYGSHRRNLDEVLPLLRNLGLRVVDQTQFEIAPDVDTRYLIRKFSVTSSFDAAQRLTPFRFSLLEALDALLSGQTDDDPLNGLILRCGLDWRQVDLLRAYCNYYLQISKGYGRRRVHRALLTNYDAASLLYKYFNARFAVDRSSSDAQERRAEKLAQLRIDLIDSLEKVAEPSDDRILRDLFNIIDSTLRTNFFLPANSDETRCIALKISGLGVINMPAPKPWNEIYIHSPSMEGVYLRSARIARGGVRWSRLRDNFRDEILNLLRAQMVKNAVVVPQGAQGGFVIKIHSEDKTDAKEKAGEAYELFLRGLLDLIDNTGEEVGPSKGLVCYDGLDAYFVIDAASDSDVGRLSDRANEIAAKYDFWLDDAFVTGGAFGFDHKLLGIVAKGAWTCVKRHFYELGRDIDEQILTVVGVGEIGSEAFGGAMLQSSNIRLIGAFNADYIFVDPTPDRIAAFGERKRLFDTPGSTWRDYNPFLISAGGGVFSRSSKNIMLSLEAQELLGTRNTSLEGDELIRLLLKLPVDLLWMGGIGTYVKASFEVNETVADRANDTARVSAPEIKAKVVGEAASLGFTQRARVEYARKGGRINTDAIDHSGSVDLSDHEVNIKILMLSRPDNAPLGANRDERYRILREVADEVGQLVVHNNYTQCLCLSLERARCLDNIASFLDVADLLENAGFLNRSAAPFPLRKEAASREAGLMRPELAILIANAKLAVKRMLIETSSVLDEDWAREFLAGYFPERLRRDFSERLHDHPLAHEIAATVISNKIIDQAGVGFLIGPSQLDASSVSEAVGIYIAFDKILQGDRWRHALHSLDGNLTTERQYELLLQLEDALAFLCRWTWEHGLRLTPDRDVLNEWDADLRQYLNYLDQSREFGLLASGAPDVSRVLFLNRLRDFPVLVHLTKCSGRNFLEVVRAFDNFTKIIGLREIAGLIEEVRPRDKWERRLQSGLDDQLRSAAARFVEAQLKSGSQDASTFFETFGLVSHHVKFQRLRQELDEASPATLTPFAALASQLDAFVDACATAGDRS